MAQSNNYVLGRGKLYFDKFLAGTKTPTGERYIGNTPSVTMTSAITMLDHFSSDEGVKVKDASAQLQTDRSGKFQTDNISPANVAMLFGTTPLTRATLAATGVTETFPVKRGLYYQLGRTTSILEGVRNVSSVTVSDNTGAKAAGTITFAGQPAALDTVTINGHLITFVSGAPGANESGIGGTLAITAQALRSLLNSSPSQYQVVVTGAAAVLTLTALAGGTEGNSIALLKSGTNPTLSGAVLSGGTAGGAVPTTANWTVDLEKGRLHVLDDAVSLADDDQIVITYAVGTNSQIIVIDDGAEVEGALRYISDNAEGDNRDYYWPDVKLSANGDYALKGDTWLTIDFNFAVLALDFDTKRVYISD